MRYENESRHVAMQRIKRQAGQFGLTVIGSRSTTKHSPQYGKLILVGLETGRIVILAGETGVYWRTLNEIQLVLDDMIETGTSAQLVSGWSA